MGACMPELRRVELTVTHWFPIVTFCPVNHLPDLIFISVTFRQFAELYAVRRQLRALYWRKLFMEDIARAVSDMFPEAKRVTVRLMFNKHQVTVEHL